MLAVVRLTVVGFLVLTVIYVCVSFYSRSVRRGKLAREWDEEIQTGDREEFIRQGMEDYDNSLRKKLILGIYIFPAALIAFLVYATNFM